MLKTTASEIREKFEENRHVPGSDIPCQLGKAREATRFYSFMTLQEKLNEPWIPYFEAMAKEHARATLEHQAMLRTKSV